MDWLTHRVPMSFNVHLIDKTPPDDPRWMAYGFEPYDADASDLSKSIKIGYAYSAVFAPSKRAKQNFLAAGAISLDFDHADPGEVASNEIVQQHATIIYTTASYTADDPRFRIVFFLEEPITNAKEYVAATRSLALRMGSDMAATDAARLFYGNSQCKIRTFNRGLPKSVVEDLVAQSINSDKQEGTGERKWSASGRSTLKLPSDARVKVATGGVANLQGLATRTSIHCPNHHDEHASAFVVVSKRGSRGVHCSVCQATFWPENQADYDFHSFDNAAKAAQEWVKGPFDDLMTREDRQFTKLYPEAEGMNLGNASIYLGNSRYLWDLPTPTGMTYVKSPKGTGKTEWLRDVVGNPSAKVLLVGHRQSLIRQQCGRLGIDCYLDDHFSRDRVGICVDSILKIPADVRYDYVVMDESEQVLAHFLGETMEGKRDSALALLRHLVAKAKNAVALDADLSWPTLRFFSKVRDPRNETATLHLNEWKVVDKNIEMYDSKSHLAADLLSALNSGERCYVASNSKTLIDTLSSTITKALPGKRQFVVTSDTSRNADVVDFIARIKARIRDYDVILASPTMSTGVDISFDNDEEVVDHVFGFFEPLVTTHFECDQQISRVRHPKKVSVYVAPAVFGFETNIDVVESDLLKGRLFDQFITGYDDRNRPVFRASDALLDLACSVVSHQRASKNNLRRQFAQHKADQGFEVRHIKAEVSRSDVGRDAMREGARMAWEEYIKLLQASRPIDDNEFSQLLGRVENNEVIDASERLSLERKRIESFYRQELVPDLIALDDRGRYREKVRLYELMRDIVGRHVSMDFADPLLTIVPSELLKAAFIHQALATAHVGLGVFEDGKTLITGDNLADFVLFMKARKSAFENLFGNELRSDLEDKPVRQLNAILDCVGLNLTTCKRTTVGGKTTYHYGWNEEVTARLRNIVGKRAARVLSLAA